MASTTKAAKSGEYEPYETSHDFDGTFQNPQWLGWVVLNSPLRRPSRLHCGRRSETHVSERQP
jgi:hypothetical protein